MAIDGGQDKGRLRAGILLSIKESIVMRCYGEIAGKYSSVAGC